MNFLRLLEYASLFGLLLLQAGAGHAQSTQPSAQSSVFKTLVLDNRSAGVGPPNAVLSGTIVARGSSAITNAGVASSVGVSYTITGTGLGGLSGPSILDVGTGIPANNQSISPILYNGSEITTPTQGPAISPPLPPVYRPTTTTPIALSYSAFPGLLGGLSTATATPSVVIFDGSTTTSPVDSLIPPQMISSTPVTTIPRLPFPLSTTTASSQITAFGNLVIDFAQKASSWSNDITLAAVKTQAVHDIEDLLDNTENAIKNLGGDFPPSVHPCAEGSSKVKLRKRFFNPLKAVESLAGDALSLANCINDIGSAMKDDIGPLSGPPPGSDILPAVQAQINAIQKAGEEETEDGSQSSSDTASASSVSSFKSSSSSSSSSTSASSCPSYVNTEDDSEQWEGVPDDDDPTVKRSHILQNPEYSLLGSRRKFSPFVNELGKMAYGLTSYIDQSIYESTSLYMNAGF